MGYTRLWLHSSTHCRLLCHPSALVITGTPDRTGSTAAACFSMHHYHMHIDSSQELHWIAENTSIGVTYCTVLMQAKQVPSPELFFWKSRSLTCPCTLPTLSQASGRPRGDSTCWDESWWSKSVSGRVHVPVRFTACQQQWHHSSPSLSAH